MVLNELKVSFNELTVVSTPRIVFLKLSLDFRSKTSFKAIKSESAPIITRSTFVFSGFNVSPTEVKISDSTSPFK